MRSRIRGNRIEYYDVGRGEVDQRAYLNRMLRLALPFFRRRNILRENASSNARYPGLAGYVIHAAPARSIWISRSLGTVTHFLGRTAAKSWVSETHFCVEWGDITSISTRPSRDISRSTNRIIDRLETALGRLESDRRVAP